MEIKVSKALCTGHAQCNAVAPDVYPLDDLGYCALTTLQVSPELEPAAREGAGACPERAITLTD